MGTRIKSLATESDVMESGRSNCFKLTTLKNKNCVGFNIARYG